MRVLAAFITELYSSTIMIMIHVHSHIPLNVLFFEREGKGNWEGEWEYNHNNFFIAPLGHRPRGSTGDYQVYVCVCHRGHYEGLSKLPFPLPW